MDKEIKWATILIVVMLVSLALVVIFFEDEEPPTTPPPPPPNGYAVKLLSNDSYVLRTDGREIDYLIEIDYKDQKLRNALTDVEIFSVIVNFKVYDSGFPYYYQGPPVGSIFDIETQMNPEVIFDPITGSDYQVTDAIWIVDNNTWIQDIHQDSFDSGNKTYSIQIDLNRDAFLGIEHDEHWLGEVIVHITGDWHQINLIIISIIK